MAESRWEDLIGPSIPAEKINHTKINHRGPLYVPQFGRGMAPRGEKSGDGAVPPLRPPPACCRLLSHVTVWGTAPLAVAEGEEEASRTMTVAIAASPYHLSPLLFLPPSPPPPMPSSPTLLSMVGCGVVCHPLPTALSAVRIYQPPPSCDRRCFRLPGSRPLLLTIASHCPVALLPSINRFRRSR